MRHDKTNNYMNTAMIQSHRSHNDFFVISFNRNDKTDTIPNFENDMSVIESKMLAW